MHEHLAVQYWQEVKQELVKKYGFSEKQAEKDIQGYRERLASHGVTDALYHWDPEDTAVSAQSGLFKKPPPRHRRRIG